MNLYYIQYRSERYNKYVTADNFAHAETISKKIDSKEFTTHIIKIELIQKGII